MNAGSGTTFRLLCQNFVWLKFPLLFDIQEKTAISFSVMSIRSSFKNSALLLAGIGLSGFLMSCGGSGGGSSAPTPVVVTPPTNNAPSFSSSSAAETLENSLDIFYTVEVSDPDNDPITRVELLDAGDAAFFNFNPDTGDVSPKSAFDYEMPGDTDSDNVYNLTFEAQDDQNATGTLDVAVSVEDVIEGFGLDPDAKPSENFDLADWKLDVPFNDDGEFTGIQAGVQDYEIDGYEHPEFFYTGEDGGLVMKAPVIGATTSVNSTFTRTELREMLRRGNRSISTRGSGDRPNLNNFAFSSAPQSAQDTAGGVDGRLRVTLAVNQVTTTGASHQIGRVIIGQIHAKDDEPVRLYYRKLPENTHGSIYAQHEIAGGEDINFDMIGGVSSSAPNPDDGFLLDEPFTYEIVARGNFLDVIISQDGTVLAEQEIDMTNSGYDVEDDFMYFKAGVYHVNNTADTDEFAQVTLYELKNAHEGYAFSE